MRTVSAASVAANEQGIDRLPPSVLEALGELAGAAKAGLLSLSVGVGVGVLHELLEAEAATRHSIWELAAVGPDPLGWRASRMARRGKPLVAAGHVGAQARLHNADCDDDDGDIEQGNTEREPCALTVHAVASQVAAGTPVSQ